MTEKILMNTIFDFKDNLAYKWFDNGLTFTRGYAYIDEKLLEEEQLCSYFSKNIKSVEELRACLTKIDGFFNIVQFLENSLVLVVDRVRSMPLFYYEKDGVMNITDCIDYATAQLFEINKETRFYFRKALFTLGDKTLYNEINQVPAGNIVVLNNSGKKKEQYFTYCYRTISMPNIHESIMSAFSETFQRTAEFIGNRTAVIPLSGGHDSRLIAYYLKQTGCRIIAYTYGLKGNPESILSEKVAEALEIEWYFIEYKPKKMQDLFKRDFAHFAEMAGNASSVPHLQEWYAIYSLKKHGVLNDTCVFVPGFTGDFLVGSSYLPEFREHVCKSEVIEMILRKHFYEEGRLMNGEREQVVRYILDNYDYLAPIDENIPKQKALEFYERFMLETRQARYIENALRLYDYFGYKWTTPFFDNEQFTFWSKVDIDSRFHRKAFFETEKKLYIGTPLEDIQFTSSITSHRYLWQAALDAVIMGPYRLHYTFGYLKVWNRLIRNLMRAKREKVKFAEWYISRAYVDLLIGGD